MQTFQYPFDQECPLAQGFGDNKHAYGLYGLQGHNGYDYSTPLGTPVRALHDGVIVFAGDGIDSAVMGSAAGLCVLLKSTDGRFLTGYAHMLRTYGDSGTQIKAGEVIGISGNSGASTGPHCHLEYLPLPLALGNGYLGRGPFPEGAGGIPKHSPLPAKEDTPLLVEESPSEGKTPAPHTTEAGVVNPTAKPRPRKRAKAVKGE